MISLVFYFDLYGPIPTVYDHIMKIAKNIRKSNKYHIFTEYLWIVDNYDDN